MTMLTTDDLARLRAMCERLIAADEADDGIALSAAVDAFSELMPEDVLELLRVYEAVLAEQDAYARGFHDGYERRHIEVLGALA